MVHAVAVYEEAAEDKGVDEECADDNESGKPKETHDIFVRGMSRKVVLIKLIVHSYLLYTIRNFNSKITNIISIFILHFMPK